MADDSGVWVKIVPDDFNLSGAPGAAVINDAASNYDSKDAGVVIDDKTYDIYTFTTPTTTRSIRLTDEAQARITDEDVLMAVATANIPNDFDGDPVELFDSRYRDVLRGAFDVTPYANPGLSLTVDTPGMADVLVVGGGGGGGIHTGGGGGGGAVLNTRILLEAKEHPVLVASGGARSTAAGSPGSNGGQSRLGFLIANGGGGAGSGTNRNGRSGSSGGGAGVSGTQ